MRRLRIWSAAIATGQEAYSILFCLQEFTRALEGWQVEVVGTGLSAGALERARAGLHVHFEIQRGLPVLQLVCHFEQVGADWRVGPEVRRQVAFERHSLLNDAARFEQFDIIFPRNVLIYFDADTKRPVLDRLATALAPDGFLVLGGTETASGVTDQFVEDRITVAFGDRDRHLEASPRPTRRGGRTGPRVLRRRSLPQPAGVDVEYDGPRARRCRMRPGPARPGEG